MGILLKPHCQNYFTYGFVISRPALDWFSEFGFPSPANVSSCVQVLVIDRWIHTHPHLPLGSIHFLSLPIHYFGTFYSRIRYLIR